MKVTPFYRNVRSEITKSPLYYFYDNGLRNWLLGFFGLPQIPTSLSGHLFENVIFNMLRTKTFSPAQIHFWRTRDQAEVDFIIEKGLEVVPVEAKHKKLEETKLTRSFKSFLGKYHSQKGYVVHLGKNQKTEVDGAKIYLVPFYSLLAGEWFVAPSVKF